MKKKFNPKNKKKDKQQTNTNETYTFLTNDLENFEETGKFAVMQL